MSVEERTASTRTITWEDPMVGAKAAQTMSGLDYLRAMAHGVMIFR